MNKKYLAIGISVAIVLSIIILIEVFEDKEKKYQDNLETIKNYRNICESAGFVFVQEGYLESPEEKSENKNLGGNKIYLSCYELKGDVKIYHRWDTMAFVNSGGQEQNGN